MPLDDARLAVIPSVNAKAVLAWCKENCPSYITSRYDDFFVGSDTVKYDFFFGNEKEALLCRLKWS